MRLLKQPREQNLDWLINYLLIMVAKETSKGLVDLLDAAEAALILPDLEDGLCLVGRLSNRPSARPGQVLPLDYFIELLKVLLSHLGLIEDALQKMSIKLENGGHLEVDLDQLLPVLIDVFDGKIDVVSDLTEIVQPGLLAEQLLPEVLVELGRLLDEEDGRLQVGLQRDDADNIDPVLPVFPLVRRLLLVRVEAVQVLLNYPLEAEDEELLVEARVLVLRDRELLQRLLLVLESLQQEEGVGDAQLHEVLELLDPA